MVGPSAGIRWLTAFIDRPASTFDASVEFWLAATGSTLSARRGANDEFATLLPAAGDPYLRVQRLETSAGGSHLDVHVTDVESAAAAAQAAGARPAEGEFCVPVFTSPAGYRFCIVGHHGERTRPAPRRLADAGHLLLDQLCIDVPHDRWSDETRFWESFTGWPRAGPGRSAFRRLQVPPSQPLRLLLQRRDDNDGPTRAHLDFASDDRAAHAKALESLGARRVAEGRVWTVLADPGGEKFCVTWRDPRTGGPPS